MDGINIIGLTVFLSWLPRKKESGLDNKELHLKIKCMKKKKIQAIEEDGFSIKSVVSGFHASLSPLTLIFITVWIFMQTYGAVEGDMLTPSHWPSLNITITSAVEGDRLTPSDGPSLNVTITSGVEINPSETTSTPGIKMTSPEITTDSDSPGICFSKTIFYSLAVFAGVAAVGWVLTIVAWLCCCKKKVTDSVGPALVKSEERSSLLHSVKIGQDQGRNPATDLEKKNRVIQTLKEQKEELGENRDQLVQQLKKTEADKAENKMKLQEVENTPGLLNEKENLLIIKWKLDDQQKEYEYFVLHVDQLVQKIDSLLEIVTE